MRVESHRLIVSTESKSVQILFNIGKKKTIPTKSGIRDIKQILLLAHQTSSQLNGSFVSRNLVVPVQG